jgi:hypothetical protein
MRSIFTNLRHLPLKWVSVMLPVMLCGAVSAQPVTNSPYSRFGIGNQLAGTNIRSSGLGNLGVAIREDSIPYVVNFVNPASYTSLGFTSFDIGAYASIATLSSMNGQENLNRFNLSYFALGFPVTKWWGGAFGLREYSSIHYSVLDIRPYANSDTSTANADYFFQGRGGLNQFFIGMAFKPFKNLSVGLNVSYLFGRMNHFQRIQFPTSGTLSVRSDNITDVGGFYLDYGVQYTAKLNERNSLVLGGTFAHPMAVRANSSRLGFTYLPNNFGTEVPRDTILFSEQKGSSVTMPWKYGAGVSWTIAGKWLVGAEFNGQLWSQYLNAQGQSDSLADAWDIRSGIEYRPHGDKRGFLGYFTRMQYRIGGHYGMSEYTVRGNQLSQYGITIGLGLPMARRKAGNDMFIQSMINVSAEWGQRGTLADNLLLEDYWVIRLGFTLNDRWFIKRKYD